MIYIYGAIAGFIYGAVVGTLKYLLVWRRMLKAAVSNDKKEQRFIVTGMMASFFINIWSLIAVYLVRNIIPFDFAATIVAAAIALSIFGRSFSIGKVLREPGDKGNKENKQE